MDIKTQEESRKPRCPQCGAFLSKLRVGYSTAYLSGLVENDYECYNPNCMLNKKVWKMGYIAIIHQKLHNHDLERVYNNHKLELRVTHANVFWKADYTLFYKGKPIIHDTVEKAYTYVKESMKSLPNNKYGFSIIEVI